MTMRIFGLSALGTVPLLLAGCATTQSYPRYAYYQVPCDTPGAVIAVPVVGPGGAPVTPPGAPADAAPGAAPGAVPAAPGTPAVATCIIAVSDSSYGYGGYGGYYGRYGRYGGYYGAPYYGSFLGFGVGFHGGGHFSGGHRSGGHFSGGHSGSHSGGHSGSHSGGHSGGHSTH